MPLSAPDIAGMFQDATCYPWRSDRSAVVFVHHAGALMMPSGQVTACDPFVGLEFDDYAQPFTVTVSPGRYPVEVCLVGWTKEGEPDGPTVPERVAAARLVITRESPVRWEMALVSGQSVDELGDDQFYGYCVDAGIGCFIDHASMSALRELVAEEDDRPGDNPLSNALEAIDWAGPVNMATTDGTANIVAFMSGWGDGAYPPWIGFDQSNRPVCFVTDFRILRHARH